MSELEDALSDIEFETAENLKKLLQEAERRGEERAWKAAREEDLRKAIDPACGRWHNYIHDTISDWRASEEYKEGK